MSRSSLFRRVGVVVKPDDEAAARAAVELTRWLGERNHEVLLDEAVAGADTGHAEIWAPEAEHDLVVVLGGDGTLLSVARRLRPGLPVLGVNLGTLGFLTELGRDELYPGLVRVLDGEYELEERALLDVRLERAAGGSEAYRCLNDAVIAKSALARIIELTLRVDGRLVATYRSDGLILSTPTGSTAYNLSAGGPIVNPLLPVTVLTPICAHTFSLRPIVVPDASRIEVTLETPQEEVYLTLDGQEGTELRQHDTVRSTRGDTAISLVRIGERTFYDGLRDKLHWGG
ncbi:MAG: NAD(+)/NADH kinase [Thermoanaerobaculia bacterium]